MIRPMDFLNGKMGIGPMSEKLMAMRMPPMKVMALGGRRSQMKPKMGAETPRKEKKICFILFVSV